LIWINKACGISVVLRRQPFEKQASNSSSDHGGGKRRAGKISGVFG